MDDSPGRTLHQINRAYWLVLDGMFVKLVYLSACEYLHIVRKFTK